MPFGAGVRRCGIQLPHQVQEADYERSFSGVNVFQAGVGASITYKGVGLYAKYGLTEFFRGDVAPVTHPWTVGITCNLYFGI